jgi:hypothetical protein
MKLKSVALQHILIFSAFLILFLFIYSPVITNHFLMTADHNFLWTHDAKWVKASSFFEFIRVQPHEGRFLDNLFYYVVYNKFLNEAKSIDGAGVIRLIGIIGIVLFGFVIYLALREFRVKSLDAFLLGTLVCTLPPFWRFLSILFVTHLIYSVLFAALAGLIMLKATWRGERKKVRTTAAAMSAASFLLFLSLNIYQPTAMVYWAIVAIPLIMSENENVISEWRFSLFVYFVTGLVTMLGYFVIVRAIYFLMHVGLHSRGGLLSLDEITNPVILGSFVLKQAGWFITSPLPFALNLWDITKSIGVAKIASVIVLLGLFPRRGTSVMKRSRWSGKSAANHLLKLFIIISLFPLSYLPHLVVKNYDMQPIAYHRTMVSLEMLIILLCYRGIFNVTSASRAILKFSESLHGKIITAILFVTVISTLFLANYYTDKYFASFSADEFRYTKQTIKEYGLSNISGKTKIQILTDPSPHIVAVYKYTIFNLTRATSVVEQHAISIVKITLKELGLNSGIPIEFIRTDSTRFTAEENTIVIDMRKFQKQTFDKLNQPLTIYSFFHKVIMQKISNIFPSKKIIPLTIQSGLNREFGRSHQ